MTDPHYVYRFYRARHCNTEAALQMIISTMKWRKCTIKLDQYRDYSFPVEFYKVSAVFPYESDKSGYPTIYIRVSQHRKVIELEEYTKAFFVHVFDKVDRHCGEKGYSLIFDLTSASYRNLDWDYLKFMINFGANYCPAGAKYILVLNVPWALNTFRKMVFSFLNDDYFKLIKFVNGNQIYDYIEPENVPYYLGGQCKRNYCSIPSDSVPIEQLVERYGYTHEDYQRIIPVYQDALDQADQFLSSVDWYEPVDYFDTPEKDDLEGKKENKINYNNNQQELISSNNLDYNRNTINLIDPSIVFNVKPMDNIVFRYDLTKATYSGSVEIENSLTRAIIFKIQSNYPNDYQVTPRHGIINGKESVKIMINMINSDWKHWSKMTMTNRPVKFRILINYSSSSLSTYHCNCTEQSTINLNEFNQLWTQTETNEVYSTIRTIEVVKEFPVKMGRRDKYRQPSVNLFRHKLPEWKDNLSIDDKLRCLNENTNSLEINQKRLTLILYLMGFAYLSLFCYFLMINSTTITSN